MRDQYANVMKKLKATVTAITKEIQEQKNPDKTKGQEHCQQVTRENQRNQNQKKPKPIFTIPQSNTNLFKTIYEIADSVYQEVKL